MLTLRNKKSKSGFQIKINDKFLEECESYKYLGVIIDKNLNWNSHIQHVCKKITKTCSYLSKLRHCVNIDTLISVYYALIHSYIRYGIIAWGTATESALQPLISIVNRAVRIMTFAPFGNIDVDSIYKYLDIPKIHDTIMIETGKFIFKRENGLLPNSDIANHFRLRNGNVSHGYYLRNRGLNTPIIDYSSSFGEKSIQFRGAKVWNALPTDLCKTESLDFSRKNLKSHIFEDSSEEDDDIYFYY